MVVFCYGKLVNIFGDIVEGVGVWGGEVGEIDRLLRHFVARNDGIF